MQRQLLAMIMLLSAPVALLAHPEALARLTPADFPHRLAAP